MHSPCKSGCLESATIRNRWGGEIGTRSMAGEVSFRTRISTRDCARSDCLRSSSRKRFPYTFDLLLPPPPPTPLSLAFERLKARSNKYFVRTTLFWWASPHTESFLSSVLINHSRYDEEKLESWRETKRTGRLGAKGMRECSTCARMLMYLSALINGPLIIRNGPIRKMVLFRSIVFHSATALRNLLVP